MLTPVLSVAADGDRAIEAAAAVLRGGGLVAFPTETVYGLGALGLDPEALERIFRAKGRPHSDPLILHVAEPEWVDGLVREKPGPAAPLMDAFWPGPLTLVMPRSESVPDLVTAGQDSVAVRMPAHPVALALIRRVGAPVAAPSANLFSRPSPTTAEHVLEDLNGRIDAVLDGGPTRVGVESTVLDLRPPEPVILRPGGVSCQELERVLGGPVRVRGEVSDGEMPASPGLLTRHYSPRAEVRLFDGEPEAVRAAIAAAVRTEAPGAKVAVLALDEDLAAFGGAASTVRSLGSASRPEDVAHALYGALRRLDAEGIERIYAHTLPGGGLGEAINDRLRRAACGIVRKV